MANNVDSKAIRARHFSANGSRDNCSFLAGLLFPPCRHLARINYAVGDVVPVGAEYHVIIM